ncbi:MAG: beta-carotene 15,15'-dioxygenase, Brp/Blh family [Myxococcales bacterium]|nr:beta-carotene 15,15'-dioxygenase, Brp/Blh family [Myxococcales bacterium]NNK41717.1 beta-carotene 15,15'-dioxygenase, Brp/Blh family [Myxococcales bacterium]
MSSFAPLPNLQPALQPGSRLRSGLRWESGSWVTDVERLHALVASVFTFGVAALHLFRGLPAGIELFILVVAVTLFGLPHGALDYLSGRSLLRRSFGSWWFLPFGIGYIGLAVVVVIAWLLAPLPTLLGFLLVSAAHFGAGDVRHELALGAGSRFSSAGAAFEAVGRGSLVLVPLLHFHPEAASSLFAYLVPMSAQQINVTITAITPPLFAVSGSVLSVIMAHHLGGWAEGNAGHARMSIEIAALAALFALAPPLVAFVVYFCFWHSFRHSLHQAAELDPSTPRAAFRAFVRHAWPTTTGAFLIGAVGYVFLGDQSADAKIIQVLFVGLSALTAPHIALSWIEARKLRLSATTNL